MQPDDVIIGLFGTCGASTWRDMFIEVYKMKDISYFNPQLPEGVWHPGCIADENKHLMEDEIILFPVLAETTGQGSLAEIGFSISATLRRNLERYFVFLIDPVCTDPSVTEVQRMDSTRTRALVLSKLQKESENHSGIIIVDTLADMLEASLRLHVAVKNFREIKQSYGGEAGN